MLQLKLLILTLFICSGLIAQEKKGKTDFNVSFDTYVSSGEDLPFWLTSNKNGIFSQHNANYQLIQAGFTKKLIPDSLSSWSYTWGGNLVYGYGGKSDFQANQYWFGARYKWLVIKAGAQADPILYGGLSSTNGNLDRSDNARPLPGISLTTNQFIPFLVWKDWLSFKGEFEEKFFSDHAFVKNAHLHHKSLYAKATLSKNWLITAGLEHFVMWGGTSPTEGEMPGISQYFNYILGLKAGPGAYNDDRLNKAGNQLGIYSVEIKKEWTKSNISFYWNHPFEDRSGMEMVNIRDGLWGIHTSKKDETALITDFVYEFMYTLNQSGSIHHLPAPTPENPNRITGRGRDNYFDHYIYRSFTYYNRMIGTPVFIPHIGIDGVADGFESTRMWMHHLGAKGALGSGIYWKTMLTWSRNFGVYKDSFPWTVPYGPPRDEFSFLGELNYKGSKLPFQVNIGIAGDYGDLFGNTFGGNAGISYRF
ncbi:MAG TPA: capsule assembly Wzi family protein [Prolixibacteraceae bacterium]